MSNNTKILNHISKTPSFIKFFKNSYELENIDYELPTQYFSYFWEKYEVFKQKYLEDNNKTINNGFNGIIFEAIFAHLLNREGLVIKSHDEYIDGTKFVKPDFLVKKGDIFIFFSLKVSIRERWKQADWESIQFKKNHPNSKCILLTANCKEAENLSTHLQDLDLNEVCYVFSSSFDELFKEIHLL